MATIHQYEIYEKQRRNVQGWSSELLAGEGGNFSEAPNGKGTMGKDIISLEIARAPAGYRFIEGSAWKIGEWSYGKSFKHIDTRARPEQPLDTCRWRKHSREIESLTEVEFGREPECSGCMKSFTLIRRRHHCRGCHVAICKDCSRKAIDTTSSLAKPQWYCSPCLSSNPHLDVQEGGGRKLMRRMSLAGAPPPLLSRMDTMPKTMKFCIECGYELPPHVKFCIDCGASQNTGGTSRESSVEDLRLSITDNTSSQVEAPVEEPVAPPTPTEEPVSTINNDVNDLSEENQRLKEMVEKLQRKLARTEAKAIAFTEEQAQIIEQLQKQVANTSSNGSSSPAPVGQTPAASTTASNAGGGTYKNDPEYAKFFKLLSMGLPAEQVKMKIQQAGLDPNVLDKPDAISPNAPPQTNAPPPSTVAEPDPAYVKYFKLLKMGMPLEQVKLKASADGLDPKVLDSPPGNVATIPEQTVLAEEPENPEIVKYKKLLKMGMPPEQVKLKMQAAGLDPALLDGGKSATNGSASGSGAPKLDLSQILKKSNSVKKQEEPALPKKESVKPNVDMRAFFWTRIPVNVVKSTVWNTLNDQKVPLENFDLEWMFRKNASGEAKKEDDAFKKKKENTAVLLLESKTQQNVGIAIARFKLSPPEVKAGLLALDKNLITVDHLSSLIALAPTLEEQDILKNYDGPIEVLGAVEKFFLEMLTIPRYTQRIKCFRFSLQFEHRVLEIQAQVDTLSAATDQIADSKKFRAILETVLAIGNYMNGGTARGGAYGFKLDALAKLHTVRGVDPKVNLMHYLARHLEEHQPELIAFVSEVPHVPEAKRLSLDQIKADINMCNSELTMLQGQVQASKNETNPEDLFYKKMAPFARDAAEVMDEVTREFAVVESSFTELVSLFGEDARKFGAMDFFSVLDEFTTELKKAFRANQSKELSTLWESTSKARDQAKIAQREKELAEKLSADQAKVLYGGVISTLSQRCRELDLDPAGAVDNFKVHSRKYGSGELTAAQFCDFIAQNYGAKVALTILPSCAKLLSEPTKRQHLEQYVESKKEGWEATLPLFAATVPPPHAPDDNTVLPISSANPIGRLRIQDITPVVGDEAKQLQRSILETIHAIFQGDPQKVKLFTSNTRKFGNQQMPAKQFYAYLIATFDGDFVARLVPDLARLLDDAEKRHALLQALCESAPGWQRFAGRA